MPESVPTGMGLSLTPDALPQAPSRGEGDSRTPLRGGLIK